MVVSLRSLSAVRRVDVGGFRVIYRFEIGIIKIAVVGKRNEKKRPGSDAVLFEKSSFDGEISMNNYYNSPHD